MKLTKNKAKLQLEKLIKKYESNREIIMDNKKHYNEALTRAEYIDPLLEIFGWDVHNGSGKSLTQSDVVVEQYIDVGNSNKPDYLLRKNGSIFYTIEAEKPSKNIHRDLQPLSQVLRYGWNANNDIGFLINFEFIQIFQTYKKPKMNANVVPWKDINYKEYIDNFDLLWDILSYDSVYNGEAEHKISLITPSTATKFKLDNSFLNELNDWRLLIGQDLLDKENELYSNPSNYFKKLNDDVQDFINQIVFLRFAEDNRLERHNENELKYIFYENYTSDPNEFDKRLKYLDSKYNSGIFKNNAIAKLLTKNTIQKIISSLYYPQSSYDFAVIDLGILGKIYEQFLQSELSVDINSKVILIKTKQAKIKSVVSTPIELVRSITHNALKNLLDKIKDIKSLLELKIADISCGSGGFLISAYDEIENRAIEIENISGTNKKLPLLLKKQIISKMLYGYDIDSHAGQITKFSLALRLLRNEDPSRFQGETPLIPSMKNNVSEENSLVSEDDIADFIAKNPKTASDYNVISEIEEINPFKNKYTKFNVILGNPPYLDTQGMKNGSSLEFLIYKSKFVSAYKQFDKYFLFIEEMMKMLKDKSFGVLLIPNKFFSINAAAKLRNFIISNKYLESIIDFKDLQLFNGKDTYLSIVTFSKNQNNYINYAIAKSVKESLSPNFSKYKYEDFIDSSGNWLFENESSYARNLYNNMKSFPRLSEMLIYKNGIQTSCNKVYIITERELNKDSGNMIYFEKKKKKWKIEKNILRPFFKNISKTGTLYTQPQIDSWVIFPYYDDGQLIPMNVLRDKYPLCFHYLNYNKDELLPKILGGKRDTGKDTKKDEWYKFGRSQGLTGWNKSKLIVGVLSKGPSTAYDNKNIIIASGGTAGYVPIYNKYTDYPLEYIEAWINYPLTDQMFKMQTTSFRNGYWTHGTNVMNRIPFLTIDKSDPRQIEIYKKIIDFVRTINYSNDKKAKDTLIIIVNELIKNLLKLRGI